MSHGHGNLCQLLRRGAELVHVALGDHGVKADGGQAVKLLKAIRRWVEARVAESAHATCAHRHATGAGQGAVGDDRDVDASGVDGIQGVGEVELEGPAAHGRVVHVLWVHVQVVGQVQAAVAH